jgi:hypothetical protein
MALNIEQLTLYKHGLGFFERGGSAEASFTLEFPRRAMDDVLKSLTVLPANATVTGVAFETPPDRNPEAQRQPLHINAERPLSSVIDAFSGRRVNVSLGDKEIEGELIGLEREDEEHLERALLVVQSAEGIRLLPLRKITNIALLDDLTQGDLAFALETKRRDEERSYARVTLSHPSEVQINYIAPAPAWRVSYRVITSLVANGPEQTPTTGADRATETTGAAGTPGTPGTTDDVAASELRAVFVQGWGIFDNTLEEDLENVQLTLTAGMPVSFRYELHEPTTPSRPLVQDEPRVISAPMDFAVMRGGSAAMMDEMMAEPAGAMMMAAAPAPKMKRNRSQISAASMGESAPVQASGDARGALFAYKIDAPVTVRRGESGMVPILSVKTRGERELLYNKRSGQSNPASSVRFKNGDLTLERGPATIIENGEYAGEAIVPFTTSGTEVILAFALELGVAISSEERVRSETRSVSVRDGSLFVGAVEYIDTIYSVDSQLAAPCVVTIEHPLQYNADLETKPTESNASEARFKVSVASRAMAKFEVVERRDRSQYESVRGLNGDRLQSFLDERLLDRKLFNELSEVLTTQAAIFSIEQATIQREADREKVRERMNDTRENLSSLDATDDSSLRKRFVKQLEAFDDEMLAFDTQDQTSREEIARLEALIANELQRLSTSTK